jgi:arsenite oxidase small subunit
MFPERDPNKISGEEDMKSCHRLVELGRRQFLRGGATAAAAAVAAGVAPRQGSATPALARITYPSTRLANVKDLKVDDPVEIQYPDPGSPGVIIKLGRQVEGGVGPDGDIVAFSTLCPHKGYPLGYVAADKTLNCPGHYSRFDCEKGGQQIWGHATQNLPQFRLYVAANGDIFAEGVDELIYGRLSNTLPA